MNTKLIPFFIDIEGLDGAGKTTLRNLISLALEDQGYEVILAREPGGTPLAEQFRELVKYGQSKYNEPMTEQTRLCLLNASRSQHIQHVIKPHLAKGSVVLCDRFFWSTLAYTDPETYELAEQLHVLLGNNLEPDLIIYLDLDHKTSLARRKAQEDHHWQELFPGVVKRDEPCDIEAKLDTRYESARLVYQKLAANAPNAVTLDACLPMSTVFAKAMEAISKVQARLNENESKRAVTSETDDAGRLGDSAQ